MPNIERTPSGHPGRSRSSAYADTVWTVATSQDTSLDIEAQTRHALDALKGNLEKLGSDKTRILSAQVLLANMKDKPQVDLLWAEWMGEDPQHWPQRACYGVDLGGQLLIEIMAVAVREVV